MRIYTRTGDQGQTSLASGQRVGKNSLQLETYGTADELNAQVGLLRAKIDGRNYPLEEKQLEWIQNRLFNLGAALADAPGEWISEDDTRQLEQWIDQMQEDLEPVGGFVLPSGSETIALSHICRTVTRRLERRMVEWQTQNEKNNLDAKNAKMVAFVNRMSDFWFQFARKMAKNEGISLFLWKK